MTETQRCWRVPASSANAQVVTRFDDVLLLSRGP
jgi:hypothetical protein